MAKKSVRTKATRHGSSTTVRQEAKKIGDTGIGTVLLVGGVAIVAWWLVTR